MDYQLSPDIPTETIARCWCHLCKAPILHADITFTPRMSGVGVEVRVNVACHGETAWASWTFDAPELGRQCRHLPRLVDGLEFFPGPGWPPAPGPRHHHGDALRGFA